jgi:hypothetical protein
MPMEQGKVVCFFGYFVEQLVFVVDGGFGNHDEIDCVWNHGKD